MINQIAQISKYTKFEFQLFWLESRNLYSSTWRQW